MLAGKVQSLKDLMLNDCFWLRCIDNEMVTANLTVCSTTWTLSPLLEDLSQYSCCLSRPSLHHLLSKIFSSPLSFYLESSLVPLSLSSSSFPLFLLSLPWSITSCFCYNSSFILLYYLILFFYWFSFSWAPVDTKEKTVVVNLASYH